MNKAALAILTLLAGVKGSFAQDIRPDALQRLLPSEMELGAEAFHAGPTAYLEPAAVTVAADPVELSALDVVAGNLRFLFNPARALEYWPEYLYEYEAVEDSGLCNAAGSGTLQQEVGMVAILVAQDTLVVSQLPSEVADSGERIHAVEPVSYAGMTLLPADYAMQASVQPSGHAEAAPNLQLEDLCDWLERDENTPPDYALDDLYFATSRAIHAQDVEFVDRVHLNLDPHFDLDPHFSPPWVVQ